MSECMCSFRRLLIDRENLQLYSIVKTTAKAFQSIFVKVEKAEQESFEFVSFLACSAYLEDGRAHTNAMHI